jgi:hypothetical protein
MLQGNISKIFTRNNTVGYMHKEVYFAKPKWYRQLRRPRLRWKLLLNLINDIEIGRDSSTDYRALANKLMKC